jgi:hypothetical protein
VARPGPELAPPPIAAGASGPEVARIVADATAYNQANAAYGFLGDPLRPITGKYYGWLIRAGIYCGPRAGLWDVG